MAKKKLSAEQKVELRKELTDSIQGGTSVAETVAAASKKWGLSTVTARWYLKKLGLAVPKPRKGKGAAKRGPGRPPKSAGAKRGPGRPPKSAAVPNRGPGRPKVSGKRGPGRPKGSKNAVSAATLVSSVQAKAVAAIKNAKAAQKLMPRWEKLVEKEQTLRRQLKVIQVALGKTTLSARLVGQKIRELVPV